MTYQDKVNAPTIVHSYSSWEIVDILNIVSTLDTEFDKLYTRLDIKIIERGESFYQKRMESIVKELESKNILENDDGRKVMWGEKRNSGIPLTIVKSDGGFTYDTSDMAALKQRVEEERADWVSIVFLAVDVALNELSYSGVKE